MKLFVDTNVPIANLTDEPARGDVATERVNYPPYSLPVVAR